MKKLFLTLLIALITGCTFNINTSSLNSSNNSTSNNNVKLNLSQTKEIIKDILDNYETYLENENTIGIEVHSQIPSISNSLPHKSNVKTKMEYNKNLNLLHNNVSRYINNEWSEGSEEEYHQLIDNVYYKFNVHTKTYNKYENNITSFSNLISDFKEVIDEQYKQLNNILNYINEKEEGTSSLIDDYNFYSNGKGHIRINSKYSNYIKIKTLEFDSYLVKNSYLKNMPFINNYPHTSYDEYTFTYNVSLEVPNINDYNLI